MKKNLLVILLLCSCASPQNNNNFNTTIKLRLGVGLPFKRIGLKKFNPLYGEKTPFLYDSLSSDGLLEYHLNVSQPTVVCMVDENNVGAGSIFVQPQDTIEIELFWSNSSSIQQKVIRANYPGDNSLVKMIRDTAFKKIDLSSNKFKTLLSIDAVDNYVEGVFQESVVPIVTKGSGLAMSNVFSKCILLPQIKLLKCFFKNEIIKRYRIGNKPEIFYADSLFANPNFAFWNTDYLEYGYFVDYLFKVVNHSKATDLPRYIEKIEAKYHKFDSSFTRIAVSLGLASFAERSNKDALNYKTSIVFNEICQRYRLNRKKYDYPDFSTPNLPSVEAGLLDKIKVASVKADLQFGLSRKIFDTAKIYFLDHWASWCGPCVKGLPYTVKLFNAGKKNLEVLFLSIDSNRESFLTATKKYSLPETQVFNIAPDSANSSHYKKLNGIEHIPTYQLIFFHRGTWHIMNASSASDPSLQLQIANVAQLQENSR